MQLILNLAIGGLMVLSALPIPDVPQKHLYCGKVLAHGLLGLLLFVFPSWITGWTVDGDFSSLHTFMQRYVGVFHIAIALSSCHYAEHKRGRGFIFGRMLAAFFCLFSRLFAAWQLSDKTTRGLLMSHQFIPAAFIIDGAWLLSEIIRFVREEQTAEDRLSDLVVETSRAAERSAVRSRNGRRNSALNNYHSGEDSDSVDVVSNGTVRRVDLSPSLNNVLYADAAVAFIFAMIHFAFPDNALKIAIRPNFELDYHHYMWSRMFGAMWLIPAIGSLAAIHARPVPQLLHLLSRLTVQVGMFVLHVYGHWWLNVFAPIHIIALICSGFCMALHLSTFYSFKRSYDWTHKSKVYSTVDILKVK